MKKGKNIIFNDYNYSSITNKNQWDMVGLLKELGHKNIIYVDQRQSLDSGIFLLKFVNLVNINLI